MIFPTLPRIVEKNARDEQIEIELRIKRNERGGAAHHLRGVLDKATAARVMIAARSGGAAKAIAPLRNERLTQRAKSRISNRPRPLDDVIPIGRLAGAQLRRTGQELGNF